MAEHPTKPVVRGAGLSFQAKQEQFLEKNRMTLSEQIQQAIKLSSRKRIPIAAAQQEIFKFQQSVDFEDRIRMRIESMKAPKAAPISFDEREARINTALAELEKKPETRTLPRDPFK